MVEKVRKGLGIASEKNQGCQVGVPSRKVGGSSSKGLVNHSNKNKRKSTEFLVERCKNKVIDLKTDVVELAKKMSLVDILNGTYLKNHHKVLLPLVILRANLSSGSDTAIAVKKNRKEKKISPQNQDLVPGVSDLQVKEQEEPETRTDELSEGKKKYTMLKNLEPRNSLETMLNKEILSYLSLVYEQE